MHKRIKKFRAAAAEMRAATEAQVAELFEPLKREISFQLGEAEQSLARLRLAYPHNNDYWMELPVGWMLDGLLEQKIYLLQHALRGAQVAKVCIFCKPTVDHDRLRKILGHDDCSEDEVRHLLMSSGAPLFACAGITGVDFKVTSSYFDPLFHVEASMPVF